MGGGFCFGIRKDGKETIFEGWTNSLVFYLFEPSFRSGGEAYAKLLKWAQTHGWQTPVTNEADE